eukprot:jgi/Mesen1/3126/ME000184S02197
MPLVNLGQELRDRGHKVYLASPWVDKKMPGSLLQGTGLGHLPAGITERIPMDKGSHAKIVAGNLSPFGLKMHMDMLRYEQNAWMTRSLFSIGSVELCGKECPFTLEECPKLGAEAFRSNLTCREEGRMQVRPDVIVSDIAASQTGEDLARLLRVPLVHTTNIFSFEFRPSFPYPLFGSKAGLYEMGFLDRLKSEAWHFFQLPVIASVIAKWKTEAKVQKLYGLLVPLYLPAGFVRPSILNFAIDFPLPQGPLVLNSGPLIYEKHDSAASAATKTGSSSLVSDKGKMSSTSSSESELMRWLTALPKRSTIVVSMGSIVKLTSAQGQALVGGLKASQRPVVWALRDENWAIIAQTATRSDPKGNGTATVGTFIAGSQIRVEEWIPQKQMMEHEATAVFVGHCGAGGVQEALYYGVPVLCLPFFMDQPGVAARLRHSGAGISLDPATMTAGLVAGALEQLMHGATAETTSVNSYVEGAERAAKYMRLLGGVKRAGDFVEYVMAVNTTDAHVLPDMKLPFLVLRNVDVYLLMLFCVSCALALVRALASRIVVRPWKMKVD